MIRKFKENPNTKENWEVQYAKKVKVAERKNEWMYEYLLPVIKGCESILEIGCGMGETVNLCKKMIPHAKVTGNDFSDTAINKARELYPDIAFIACDAMELTGKYDLVICSQTLEHVDEPEKMVRKIKELGKRVFITVPWPNSGLDNGVHWHINRFYPEDFKEWLGEGVTITRVGKNHMVIT